MVLKKKNYVVLLGEKDFYKNWLDDSVSESLVFCLVVCIRMTHSSFKQKKLSHIQKCLQHNHCSNTWTWDKKMYTPLYERYFLGFSGGSVAENPPANSGDIGSIPDLGRSHMPQSN